MRRGEPTRRSATRREVRNERGEVVYQVLFDPVSYGTAIMDADATMRILQDELERPLRPRAMPPSGPEGARRWAADFWKDAVKTWETKEANRQQMAEQPDQRVFVREALEERAMVSVSRSEREARARQIRGFGVPASAGETPRQSKRSD